MMDESVVNACRMLTSRNIQSLLGDQDLQQKLRMIHGPVAHIACWISNEMKIHSDNITPT